MHQLKGFQSIVTDGIVTTSLLYRTILEKLAAFLIRNDLFLLKSCSFHSKWKFRTNQINDKRVFYDLNGYLKLVSDVIFTLKDHTKAIFVPYFCCVAVGTDWIRNEEDRVQGNPAYIHIFSADIQKFGITLLWILFYHCLCFYTRSRLYRTWDIMNPRYIKQFFISFYLICLDKRLDITNPRYIEQISGPLECSK